MEQEDLKQFIKNKLSQAEQIMDRLQNTANQDDKITKDEINLLENLKQNIDNYTNLMIGSLDSNHVSDEEMRQIHVLEKKILQDARAKVFEDGIISKDESNLLSELTKIFEELADTKEID